MAIKPFLLVNIAGILSPILQQLLSVEVNLRISAHFPFAMLATVKELMYNSMKILYDGPQVGSVSTRFSWPIGVPTEYKIVKLHIYISIYPFVVILKFSY